MRGKRSNREIEVPKTTQTICQHRLKSQRVQDEFKTSFKNGLEGRMHGDSLVRGSESE